MEEKPKYENSVLYQKLEQYFKPATNWEGCQMPLTSAEFWQKVNECLPGYFGTWGDLEEVLITLHYQQSYNEHNHKWYWLVNAA